MVLLDNCMETIRYDDIVGDYYYKEWNTVCAIIARGVPSMSWGKDTLAETLLAKNINSIIPDYYGYARSSKRFTPQNCIQTIQDTYTNIKSGKTYTAIHEQKTYKFTEHQKYIIIGHSFGGRVAAMLPKFEQTIDTIALIAPQLNSADYNQCWHPEEDNKRFFGIIKDWYEQLYRGIEDSDRLLHLHDKLWLTPMLQPEVLKDSNVFIGHGTSDDVIRYGRSKKFYETLQIYNYGKNIHFDAYYWLWHSGLIKEVAATWIAHRIKTELHW